MKNIFVVTHTQSVHHVENKVGGWYDTELTPKGKADAQATAEKLVALIGNASVEIFSSDLLRASQTAAIIAEHLKSPFETTDGLREISYGSAGGLPQEWLDARQIPAPITTGWIIVAELLMAKRDESWPKECTAPWTRLYRVLAPRRSSLPMASLLPSSSRHGSKCRSIASVMSAFRRLPAALRT